MFRFAIRDLLWLTVVVALGVGWWKEHQRAEHAAAIAAWRRDLRQVIRGPLEVDE